jgi:hypothetical protein
MGACQPPIARRRSPSQTCASKACGLLIYCADYRCSHSVALNGDHWPDDARLSDIEPGFNCAACGNRGADIRTDFNWNKQSVKMMGYR